MIGRLTIAVAVFSTLASEAHAAPPDTCWRFLPGRARRVQLDDTASRDAAVLEYAFGPRAQLSLGHALTLASDGDTHLVISGLAALEDGKGGAVFPDQAMRILGTAAIAWDLGEHLELGLELGVERARELVAAEPNRLDEPIDPRGIPFGGGGVWLGLDLAWRGDIARGWTLDARVADRMYVNAWPLLFGFRAESDVVASFFGEGLTHAPSLAVDLRWAATPTFQPVARLFLEGLFAHDDNADSGYFARMVLGTAFVGDASELLPFVSVDIGNGKGLFINRHELRLSFGVRHAFR